MDVGDSERRLMTGNTKEPTTSTQLRNEIEEEEGVGGEDRISSLPEPLILHILSLLPTKCAVSTTVLSKGWKDLWVSVPILDFREWKSPNTEETLFSANSFMDFVDRVLVLRNMSEIKRFCIACDSDYFVYKRIKAWITKAIKCRVEELIVCRCRCLSEKPDIIPVDLYTCESLTLLDIQLWDNTLYLPQMIYLPRLKILRLAEISFRNKKSTQQLFSGCPVLEELSLRHCSWRDLNFISSTLKVLTLFCCLRTCCDAITTIDAPNLMSITIVDGIQNSLVVDSFPSLVDADIQLMYSVRANVVDVIPNFVKKLSNVKHLKLSAQHFSTSFENLELGNVQSAKFPTFANLTTMEVYTIGTNEVRSLFTFLQFSPNLESLVFRKVRDSDIFNEDALALDVAPHCLLMHLKSIKFQKFEGHLQELDLVQLFLQHAGVLRTVTIEVSSRAFVNSDSEKKKHTAKDVEDFNKKIMEQLLKYKRASIDCVINISIPPVSCQNQ